MFRFIVYSFLFIPSVFAATTGSITLSGSIPQTISIVVSGQGSYNNLNLSSSTTDLVVANVIERCNIMTGYSVSISSANNGQLKNGTLGQIPYTAKYNNTSFSLSSTPVTVTDVTSQTSIVNVPKQLTITYSATDPESIMAGTYSDTLTFTITAN